MAPTDTKTSILDAAEKLFAHDGFHLASLRALTAAAKVNLAAVNYHFGSKEALLQAVIERRLLPLNRLRTERIESVLHQAKQSNQRPETERLLRAFIEPTLAFRQSGPGAEEFITLIGRSLSEPDQTVRNCFQQQVTPLFLLLVKGMQLALPTLETEVLLARLQFTMAAMAQVMCSNHHLQFQTTELSQPLADEELTRQLIKFTLAGLEAPQ